MKEVMTLTGPTPDPTFIAQGFPKAVREWCINTAVVDPLTDSILANSEDGKLYRWNLKTNSISQRFTLTPGLGEAYTPTAIGPDGTVYAINNAILFAVGLPGLFVQDVSISESNLGQTELVFTVMLSSPVKDAVTVHFNTSDRTASAHEGDYQPVAGKLTFRPGTTSQTIRVRINADMSPERKETFFLNLSNPINAVLGRARAAGTILDDGTLF
jgi:hypothetical protein